MTEKKKEKEKFKILDTDGMPIPEQAKIIPLLRKRKYQVSIKLKNGKTKYIYLNDPKIAEIYVKGIEAKILKVNKIKDE